MSNIPDNLRYTKSHEWVRAEDDGSLTIGITDHAQDLLGDLVFIELPDVGRSLDAGEQMAIVESVKAASDVYAPFAGEVLAVNDALPDSPETLNSSPYEDGWLVRLKPAGSPDLDGLMQASAYAEVAEADEH